MDNNTINKNYYRWDISQGDYLRDYESTKSYENKLKLRKRIKSLVRIFIFMGLFVATLSFLAFYFF